MGGSKPVRKIQEEITIAVGATPVTGAVAGIFGGIIGLIGGIAIEGGSGEIFYVDIGAATFRMRTKEDIAPTDGVISPSAI